MKDEFLRNDFRKAGDFEKSESLRLIDSEVDSENAKKGGKKMTITIIGGKCFDLAAFILHKKFTINSIRVKKFTQNTYFKSSRVSKTGFKAPVALEEGLRRTIDYEFVKKTQGHVFHCE